MKFLKVEIIEVDVSAYPGFVTCVFNDAYGKKWEILEKYPYFTEEDFSKKTVPFSGFYIPGNIIAKQNDKVVYFRTEFPDTKVPIFADDLTNEFYVFIDQLSDIHSGEETK